MIPIIGFVITLLFIGWVCAVTVAVANQPYIVKREVEYTVIHKNEKDIK
tara:strand:- start:356 stop:502 length:147 start_codon:yes stop_codon:yes gene_type:complete